MGKRVRVCSIHDIKAGKPYSVYIGKKRIAAYKAEGRFFVLDDECLHRGAPLSEGVQDGMSITCPLHDWTYDIQTGALLDQEGMTLRTYPVTIENDEVFIDWPDE